MGLEGKPVYSYNFDYSEKIMNKGRRQKAEDKSQNAECKMQNAEAGFTIVELMITMVAFVFVIAAASQMLTGLLTQFKQQSKIAETNIEGIIGLNILRQDIEHAGMGLPWNGLIAYNEPALFNDSPNAPRAIISNNNTGTNGSDYLVIKSAGIALDAAAGRNTRLVSTNPYTRPWFSSLDDLASTDRVIVISPGATEANSRSLVVVGGTYDTPFSSVSSYAPADNTDIRIVYGISDSGTLAAPFNRADYYVRPLAVNELPRCAPNTGVLVKATLNHTSGVLDEMPVLDCVADLQVVYAMDNDEDGDFQNGTGGDAYTNSLTGLTAQQIRTRVKEVQVYILAHEGQRDPNFTFNNFTAGACVTCVRVGRPLPSAFGRDFDLSAITDYEDYRWKVYTISVKTENLGS